MKKGSEGLREVIIHSLGASATPPVSGGELREVKIVDMGEEKTCPRCGKGFVCRKDAPSLCQCAGIVLSERHRAYLKQTYSDCLCASCLREIAKLTF